MKVYIKNILLGDENEDSAAKQIIAYKKSVLKNPNHPLYNNLIINSLKYENIEGRVNNLYISGRDNKVYDQNQIIYAFREIKEEISKDLIGKTAEEILQYLKINSLKMKKEK